MQKTQKINSFAFAVTKSCQVTLAECGNSAAVLAAHFTLVGVKVGMELAARGKKGREGSGDGVIGRVVEEIVIWF